MEKTGSSAGFDWGQVVSPVLDGLTFLAYLYLLPWLAHSFLTPSYLNGVIVGSAFLLLLAAVYSLMAISGSKRKTRDTMSGQPPRRREKHQDSDSCCCAPWFYIAGVCFFYCAFLALVFLDTTTSMDWNDAAFENWGVGLMLGAALAVLITLVLPSGTGVSPKSSTGLVMHIVSVTGVAFITIVAMAFWESIRLADPGGSPEPFTGIWKLVMFLLMWLVFTGFLGPPRLLLHLSKGDRFGLVTYLASIGYYVWDMFGF